MSRKSQAVKREILPDPKYKDKLVAKFVNQMMERGKKGVAEKIIYGAFNLISEKAKDDPLKYFKEALENVKPLMEVRSRRVGGATYQVPIEIQAERGATLAMRWIRDFAISRKGKPMHEKLAQEIFDAYTGTGQAVKKREDTHKMAEANKAFSHYRW